jgi:hypothetical protein
MPLLSTRVIGVDEPVVVEVLPNLPAEVGAIIAPARLSTFTPALWCQFSEAMSMFDATFEDGKRMKIATSDLEVTISSTIVNVGALAGRLSALAPIAYPESESDGSQIEELLVTVVTRHVRDVF